MGATNSTLHYQLSQFISTDKPAWLQDYNGDMQKIDAGINGALTAAESAQNSADSASSGVSTLGDAVSALTTTVSGHTSDITDLSGDVNTIESLIGNGIPTAGDHTLIGAINTNTAAIIWTALTPVTGTTSVSLPANFNELHVLVDNGTGRWTFNLLKDELSSSATRYNAGAALQAGGSYYTSITQIDVSTGALQLHECNANGVSYTATATTSVYYR